jgi:hypothetical protein
VYWYLNQTEAYEIARNWRALNRQTGGKNG